MQFGDIIYTTGDNHFPFMFVSTRDECSGDDGLSHDGPCLIAVDLCGEDDSEYEGPGPWHYDIDRWETA